MKITGPQAISELREKLQFEVGRHLYGLLGTYAQLAAFEQADLVQACDPDGDPFLAPINLNRELLARIGDDDLRQLVQAEARRPKAIQRRLGQELDDLLGALLADDHLLILKQLELTFAYSLDLSVFRTRATDRNHILLLLPGEQRGEGVILFHEADPRFHRLLPGNLIADNHIWELKDG
jgi:hypothetical protein